MVRIGYNLQKYTLRQIYCSSDIPGGAVFATTPQNGSGVVLMKITIS